MHGESRTDPGFNRKGAGVLLSALKSRTRQSARLLTARASAFAIGSGLRVLLYHRFPKACGPALSAQCEFLREQYTPIALREAIGLLERNEALPPNAVAVTIDDGYADYFHVAHPCFVMHGIPTTVFVTERFIDGSCWLWFDRLTHAVRASQCAEILTQGNALGETLRMPLVSESDRAAACRTLVERAKEMPHGEVEGYLASMEQALQSTPPPYPDAEDAAMAWGELKSISASGMTTIGAHTASHPILSRLSGSDEIYDEVGACRERMQGKLGEAVEFFAYPNGQPEDIDRRALHAVEAAGFRAAFTTSQGVNRRRTHRFLMKRLAVRPEFPVSFLADALATAR